MRCRRVITVMSALCLSGCGLSSAPPAPAPIRIIVREPPAVDMSLRAPGGGVVASGALTFATRDPSPVVRGSVSPASATVYIRVPGGGLATVQPRPSGVFSVRTDLEPGRNRFQFMAYRLGSIMRSTRVTITWKGAPTSPQRAPMATAVVAAVPEAPGTVTVAGASGDVPLDPIHAPAPPAAGGDGRWIGGFELTEYYPALESWSMGAMVPAPGLSGPHRIDWLYSAHGLSMEGEGIGLDGRWYHIASLGTGGWLTSTGGPDAVFGGGTQAPYWRTGGFWRTAAGTLTFPLDGGGWSAGPGRRYVPPPTGISFAAGVSRPLGYLRSIAVDPRVIPLGSYVYIPAYVPVNGGWFEAQDTGGAITGRHIDVFRPPPSTPTDTGNFATGQPVYVIPPGHALP